jgi:hypothetical protein
MKKINLLLILFFSLTVKAQKITSYKYESEVSEATLTGYQYTHKKTQSRRVTQRRTINTIFVVDSAKKTVTIGKQVWEITSKETYSCILYLNMKTCELSFFDFDKAKDVELLLTYDDKIIRYYIKQKNWTRPVF